MSPRLLGIASMSALGLALVVAFGQAPLSTLVGTVAKGIATFVMIGTLYAALTAPVHAGQRPPVTRTVLAVVATIAAMVLGSWFANWAGAALEFVMALCVACLGATVVYLGWTWWDDPARRGGWFVVVCGAIGMVLALMSLPRIGGLVAGMGGGFALLGVAAVSAYRARW